MKALAAFDTPATAKTVRAMRKASERAREGDFLI
jgi:hypothetical protein